MPPRNRVPMGWILLALGLVAAAAPLGCDTGAPDLPESNFQVMDDSTQPLRHREDPFVHDPRLFATPPDKRTLEEDEHPEPPQEAARRSGPK